VVSQSVCLSVRWLRCAKIAEAICPVWGEDPWHIIHYTARGRGSGGNFTQCNVSEHICSVSMRPLQKLLWPLFVIFSRVPSFSYFYDTLLFYIGHNW